MTATVTVRAILSMCVLLAASRVAAAPLNVAVASNFAPAARAIASEYESRYGGSVRVATGSTGKLYAQIVHGAPYDILLAADAERPALLEASGLGVAGARFTYAVGQLVLWSADPELRDSGCEEALTNLGRRKLAIANPETAPYGVAARQFLESRGLWSAVEANLVYGENIVQTLQFVATRNAGLGLIAAAQAGDARLPEASCRWPVPADSHEPLEQQAILLRRASDNAGARAFLDFLLTPPAREIIRAYGYADTP